MSYLDYPSFHPTNIRRKVAMFQIIIIDNKIIMIIILPDVLCYYYNFVYYSFERRLSFEYNEKIPKVLINQAFIYKVKYQKIISSSFALLSSCSFNYNMTYINYYKRSFVDKFHELYTM